MQGLAEASVPFRLAPSREEMSIVVTKSVLRAADDLGLSARRLAQVIGISEPSVSRMKADAFKLEPESKPYELSVLLIRIFRSLDAIAGGDADVVRQWLGNANTALGGKPVDKLVTITGLVDVLAYLDARRALV